FGVKSEKNTAYLSRATGQECQTLGLGESWLSESVLVCYLKCLLRYPTTCQSVVYSATTKSCTPGSVAFGPLEPVTSIPDSSSGDTIYYKRQPTPPCNISGDFTLYDICGTTACLHLSSSKADYFQAVQNCQQSKSRLFIADTMVRVSVFWHVSLKYLNDDTLIGLRDLAGDNWFFWDNGVVMAMEQRSYIWGDFSSRKNGNCVEAKHSDSQKRYGFDDVDCMDMKQYICEPYDAYDAE
ncbi:hypothetical protein RRG08_042889, partial [Elysia crispata]